MFGKKKKDEIEVPLPPPQYRATSAPIDTDDIEKQIRKLQLVREEQKRQELPIIPELKVKTPTTTAPQGKDEIDQHIDKVYGTNYLYALLKEQIITNELLRQAMSE